MIELKNITKKYGDLTVLKDVSVTVRPGDVIAIIGPSGTGKSTLLNCMNILDRPTSGQVLFDGVDLTDPKCDLKKYRRRLGMVFQQFNLFGHMTVIENVVQPQIDLLHRSPKEAYEKAMEYLRLVGMAEKKLSYPRQLSGGQKQRAAIARTLALDPEVLLLDEPTSALDPTMVGEVEYVIKKLAAEKRTMVIVTHEMRFAREISNRVFYMDEQGIYEDGPTEQIFDHPRREKTRRFIQRLKCLELSLSGTEADYIQAMEAIRQFGEKLAFSRERIHKAQLLFEELCIEKLLPLGKVRCVFEYKEQEDVLSLTVVHGGSALLTDGGDTSSMLIRSLQKTIPVTEILE